MNDSSPGASGAIANAIEVVECNHPKSRCRMHRTSISKFDNLPHSLHQIRLRQYPSTTDNAQPVCFRQTAGNDEVRSKVKCRLPWLVEQGLEVDLVHQYTHANLGSYFAHSM